MLNIGPMEFVMICVVALIVLGPDKLPQALRTVGRVSGELRRLSSGFQNEIRYAFEEETLEDRRRRTERETVPRAAEGNGHAPADPDATPDSSGPDQGVAGEPPDAGDDPLRGS